MLAKILNLVAQCLPCLTNGIAEIQLSNKIYYVYRSSLATVLQCDVRAPCSNLSELRTLALTYFNKRQGDSSPPSPPSNSQPFLSSLPSARIPSSIEHQVADIHQGMGKMIADKQKGDIESRKHLKTYKENSRKEDDKQIAEIRASVAHLPSNDPKRLASERFIKTMQKTRESMLSNLDEIATASGIAPEET